MTFRVRAALRRIAGLLCIATLWGGGGPPAAAAPAKADNVVIIMVDGLRPDAIKQARTPVLDGLIKHGASTMKAQTVNPSLTLPAFASLLTGLPVAEHGVDWNEYENPRGYIKAPTVFEIASFNGSKWGAIFIQKEKLLHVAKPDRRVSLHLCSINEHGCSDMKIADEVVADLKKSMKDPTRPSLFLIHLAETDTVGHAEGWMSKPYLKAVEAVDRAIGIISKGFKDLGLYAHTAFIVSSDHGGHGTTHGTATPEDMTIPWIAAGPGIKAGYEIKQPVSLIDTPATVMRAFGITDYYVEWKSRPIEELFENQPAAGAPSETGRPNQ